MITDYSMQGSDLACNPEQLDYPARPMITDYSRQGFNFACNLEQLDYPARPLTLGAEEIMRIYENRVYRPPDMINRSGDSVSDQGDLLYVKQKMNLMQETLLLV